METPSIRTWVLPGYPLNINNNCFFFFFFFEGFPESRKPMRNTPLDQDVYGGNCATQFRGAWWYSHCHSSNLNSVYERATVPGYANTVVWYDWKGHHYSLKFTAMKIKLVPWRDHCSSRNLLYKLLVYITYARPGSWFEFLQEYAPLATYILHSSSVLSSSLDVWISLPHSLQSTSNQAHFRKALSHHRKEHHYKPFFY